MNSITKALGRVLLTVGLVLGLIVAGAVPAGVSRQPQPTPTTTVLPDGPQQLGGVIRLYADGPEWHVDADHWIHGIDPTVDPVIDSSGLLTFMTLEKNAVVNCEGNPDETLVKRGVTVGCTNGSHLVRLQFVKVGLDGQPAPLDLNDPVHYSRVSGAFSNVWVDIVHDGAWTP